MTNLNIIFHVVVSGNLKLAPVSCWISERPILWNHTPLPMMQMHRRTQNRGHIVLKISPAPPFNVGCTNAIDGREFLLQHWTGRGGIFSNIWDQGCIQTCLILRQRPPKPYKLLKFYISFATTVKSCHATSIWKKLRWKSLCLPILKITTEIKKNLSGLYGFGRRCLKIRDVCLDFEPYFKAHNLVNVHPKHIKLGQMTKLDMTFYVMASDYRLIKIWSSPQFPVEFRNGLLHRASLLRTILALLAHTNERVVERVHIT